MAVHFNSQFILAIVITVLRLSTAADHGCIDHYKGYCVIDNVTFSEDSSYPEEKSLLILNSTLPTFGENYFRKLPSVENLMIHHLKIEQLNIAGCGQLKTLFACYNHISEVTVAKALPLQNLHLYQNMLSNVSALRELTELEQLYLNDNLIEILEMDVFANMKSLKILTLHRNMLTAIDTNQPVNLPSLKSLFLQHNKLMHLDTGLWRMPALQVLDLSANEFGFLFTFLEEFSGLKILEIHDNKWNCAWLFKMIDRMEFRGIEHKQVDDSCESTMFGDICCLAEGATPDPMMLLISRTAIVDDLQDRLGNQQEKVDQLEEAQRKQTYRFEELRRKIEHMEKFCRDEL